MDRDDIRYLLGNTIYSRAVKYVSDVEDYECRVSNNGVRHISAGVFGSGSNFYDVDAWLRPDGSFVSARCDCPYNEKGDGPCCKHIGALLLYDMELEAESRRAPLERIPGVIRAVDLLRQQIQQAADPDAEAPHEHEDGYTSALNMLFGSKWRGGSEPQKPRTDMAAQEMLDLYRDGALAESSAPLPVASERQGTVELEPLLKLYQDAYPTLRVRISDGGRGYIVKSIQKLLTDIERGETVEYGKSLTLTHSWEALSPDSQWLVRLLRRQESARKAMLSEMSSGYYYSRSAQAESVMTGGDFDELVAHYGEAQGQVGGYDIIDGWPKMTLNVSGQRGGVKVSLTPLLYCFEGLDYNYIFSNEDMAIWRLSRKESQRLMPALRRLFSGSMFFTTKDATAFCSYVLPDLGSKLTFNDPDRLLLNQIPLEAVVQYYLDVPREGAVMAHAEFVYGEDRVTPFAPAPVNLLRDSRAEARASRLLASYLEPGEGGNPAVYSADDEDGVYRFLDEGVPALLASGEVYLSDAFRRMQAAPPKISVGVSVHGSVLDLDVDTGEFPLEELRELMQSIHSKKRYHRLRDGRLLKLDESMEALEELDETLELSGAQLGQAHAQLPLYRAPTLDRALSGQSGVHFSRDDAFRRISRSFHAVKDSEYTLPESLQSVLRKYQRDGYRWLRTLDGYGMGGILADDMGLGKTLQVLAYLLALKEGGQTEQGGAYLPSLIVCPASLVLNWAEECQKFTPALRCVPVDGDAAHRAELAEQWDSADLIVTSYDLLRRDKALYDKREFYACILDEAQAVKNHTTQKYKAVCRVKSRVRFALTGTPVENRLGELWSIFSFLMPGYLPPYKSFCARFEKPIAQDKDENAARRLNQLTGPFILRRMKSEVLKELPPKTESVYRIELGEQQRKLYLAAVVDAREKLRAAKPEDKMAVFAVLMRLREICCDPRLITDSEWTGGSAKLDACMDLVVSAVEGGHRILLFSQFTSMLELLAKRLDEEGISHFTLQGSTPKPERAELVRRFNAGEASVFLISLRAGGTGLNLTAADIVIHYDPWWNVAAQNQATDRAYRIGQQNPVQVYKLIAQDTIEEKILELQQAKQTLAETVTGSADGAILSMRPDELLALLDGE